ncbi:hypothetical protein ACO0RG_001424 [Hanseniaspora osmophila]|uniref:DNA replication complex GINS protein SLD5 n=1 Tax=Hanseniaspora osmophila TaxID=56408 RepID=A0A1E5R0H9_9ASCO|nr:DNA replication complex GINS protein SLD5 [Hanseniaspora osmophila]
MDIDDILADLDDTTNVYHPPSSSYGGRDQSINTSATVLPSDAGLLDDEQDMQTGLGKDKLRTNIRLQNQQSNVVQKSPAEDYQELVTIWRNERMSPELLPYPKNLMKRILAQIEAQVERIEFISMGYDEPTTTASENFSTNDHAGARAKKLQKLQSLESTDVFDKEDEENYDTEEYRQNRDKKLPLLCMEAELERVKFLVRSFIRCRLSKIDKYLVYIRQNDVPTEELDEDEHQGIFSERNDSSGNLSDSQDLESKRHPSKLVSSGLLSPTEYQYLIKHSDILLKYFNNTVLQHMPPSLQLINDTESTVNMVDEPDMEQFVFIFVRGSNDEGASNEFDVHINGLDEDVTLITGGIYVMRYNVIRSLLREGVVVLI